MRKTARNILLVIIIILVAVLGINIFVVASQNGKIIFSVSGDASTYMLSSSAKDGINRARSKKVQCIIVLGAAVRPDGTPSKMLADRLEVAAKLYKNGVTDKVLLSGDNGTIQYNEVKAMKNYMISAGIPAKDIFLDYAGFSTYDSMYRAKEVFKVSSAVIVTQRYHEYRALYIANWLGIKAWGVSADQKTYSGQAVRSMREILARDKDVFNCIRKAKPKYLGTPIPITGQGNGFSN